MLHAPHPVTAPGRLSVKAARDIHRLITADSQAVQCSSGHWSMLDDMVSNGCLDAGSVNTGAVKLFGMVL